VIRRCRKTAASSLVMSTIFSIARRTNAMLTAVELIEHRGDRSASGHIRMAKLHAVAKATGPLQHRNCTGGCNTFCPARSYPIIGGPAVNAVDVVKSTRAYCPQRFANQQRTSQFLLASSFTALRPTDPPKDLSCSCN
jgi:hypothetical protein